MVWLGRVIEQLSKSWNGRHITDRQSVAHCCISLSTTKLNSNSPRKSTSKYLLVAALGVVAQKSQLNKEGRGMHITEITVFLPFLSSLRLSKHTVSSTRFRRNWVTSSSERVVDTLLITAWFLRNGRGVISESLSSKLNIFNEGAARRLGRQSR